MCEPSVFIIKNGKEELVLESIHTIESMDGKIRVISLLAEEKTLEARIKALALVDHKIILEPL